MLSSLFSSFVIHADAPEEKEQLDERKGGEKEEGEEEAEPEAEAEEEEEAEPEDVCFSVSRRVKECN